MNSYHLKNLDELHNFMSASVVTPPQDERHPDLSDKYQVLCRPVAVYHWWANYGTFDTFKEAETKLNEIANKEKPYMYMIVKVSYEVVMTNAIK